MPFENLLFSSLYIIATDFFVQLVVSIVLPSILLGIGLKFMSGLDKK